MNSLHTNPNISHSLPSDARLPVHEVVEGVSRHHEVSLVHENAKPRKLV